VDPAEQLKLMREFMLAIAPVVTAHHLDQGGFTPSETAKTVLEWSMHLSSQFAACHDAFHATPENAPKTNAIKAVERETGTTAAAVQQAGTGLSPGAPDVSNLR
jgi:hypothetical protein